jgi:hypothetical protein
LHFDRSGPVGIFRSIGQQVREDLNQAIEIAVDDQLILARTHHQVVHSSVDECTRSVGARCQHRLQRHPGAAQLNFT